MASKDNAKVYIGLLIVLYEVTLAASCPEAGTQVSLDLRGGNSCIDSMSLKFHALRYEGEGS